MFRNPYNNDNYYNYYYNFPQPPQYPYQRYFPIAEQVAPASVESAFSYPYDPRLPQYTEPDQAIPASSACYASSHSSAAALDPGFRASYRSIYSTEPPSPVITHPPHQTLDPCPSFSQANSPSSIYSTTPIPTPRPSRLSSPPTYQSLSGIKHPKAKKPVPAVLQLDWDLRGGKISEREMDREVARLMEKDRVRDEEEKRKEKEKSEGERRRDKQRKDILKEREEANGDGYRAHRPEYGRQL